MKYNALIQRLRHNPDEAVIVYRGEHKKAAWIINRQGVVRYQWSVDDAVLSGLKNRSLSHVASMTHSRAAIIRPSSDAWEESQRNSLRRRKHRMGRRYMEATTA